MTIDFALRLVPKGWEWLVRSPASDDSEGRPTEYFASINAPGSEALFQAYASTAEAALSEAARKAHFQGEQAESQSTRG